MSNPIWKPNATVAAIVEHEGRFLLVEEETDEGLRFNQPAGHLDHGESLLAACVREAREETGYRVVPVALVGIYQWSPPARGDLTYLRFAYAATVAPNQALPAGVDVETGSAGVQLDEGIVRAVWLHYDEVLACRARHRSPLVLQCIDDYRAGRRFSLDVIQHHD
jgi:8-oxo-dGTP pyrophosphatase MutT (NUDIX family)